MQYKTLTEAQTECSQNIRCHGITRIGSGKLSTFNLRAQSFLQPNLKVRSWKKITHARL